MKIKAGTKLLVKDRRKGDFLGVAEKDFDTEHDEFFPVILDQDYLIGMANVWEMGERVPCRKDISFVEIRG